MTVLDRSGAQQSSPHPAPPPAWRPAGDAASLLPQDTPYRVLGSEPLPAPPALLGDAAPPDDAELLALHGHLAKGRRYNEQATALTKQGSLAVYPSSTGQEACQVAAALALAEDDWLFPSYRDSLAAVARGVDPVEVLSLLRGDWHSGYDSRATRVAPLSTPLATQLPHAVGLAHAARLAGDELAVLALVGDGGTSEGDFHEALNFAAVWQAPVVFLVQNNGFAISVPLAKQTAAPSLAHKGVGYGLPGVLVDGNDAAAVRRVLSAALDRARSGGGPVLVEALTYRLEAHTNADDATRYRADDEVAAWRAHDPIALVERELTARGLLTEAHAAQVSAAAEEFASDLRGRMRTEPSLDPADLFAHVYARPTQQLEQQQAQLQEELAAAAEGGPR
ncbi:thiamine pyrophosphate-dependent enzyme [Streptomyces xiaopingdaonensis]|uniref:thiamine pyrophosphate-dependent enzyme n=1 Tax=Streptomyces xiaopingdaonensis TaxID=1565415 RepID=UPI00031E8EEE|nr:thiamine pyrophosphate-dependent enzyme [Streptomyces xiaopingdaonensis]